ncbi:MAG TPA: S9 family peptidase, partial [Bacteroidota bacterium]
MKKTALLFLIIGFTVGTFAQTKSPLTFDRLIGMERVSDPQLSPDGKTAAFVVTTHDPVNNAVNSNIHLVSLESGAVRPLTSVPKANNSPRWTPDGKTLFFVSTRDGESQIWKIPAAGGEATKVSTISTEASGLVLSADGKLAAFASDVFPDCPTDDCNKKRNEEMAASKVKARIITRLPYRIWNYWKDGKRSHAFIMSAD